MHSITGWKLAQTPNYITNKDKVYPYSECPFLGQYRLVKLPPSPDNLIEHVDYWGEGRIVTQHGISGFSDCYNVNHTYQLVSNGPDRGRKIPNRIPVVNYTNCDTSGYIKDNSVKTVTIMGAPINSSCAEDIGRMVNADQGKVVAYGFETSTADIKNLTRELKKKDIFLCPRYILPNELQGLSLFDSDLTFLNLTLLKNQLYKNVTEAAYDTAVDLTKSMDTEKGFEAIGKVVTKLIDAGSTNIMAYTYKLWNSGGNEIVRKSFPDAIQLILKGELVTIINQQYQQALKLDANINSSNDRLAWGDKSDKTSRRVSWKFTPIWENDNVVFKINNMEYNMFLKLDVNTDSLGDRKGWGSTNDNEINHEYYVKPVMKDGTLVFRIINYQYNQALKLDANVDSYGDRQLWGHNGDAYGTNSALDWVIAANTKTLEGNTVGIYESRRKLLYQQTSDVRES
ncbi:hypothetical protein PYW07_009058 [Mythimna separata]|uniref:Uncharacterized protein n=1 Tax=Mythimna separata TaxID=271217 RepID=A0AAD7YAX7_MYTSE|nr:hypothetical protein PYW07_009058 [Mythimna separata]